MGTYQRLICFVAFFLSLPSFADSKELSEIWFSDFGCMYCELDSYDECCELRRPQLDRYQFHYHEEDRETDVRKVLRRGLKMWQSEDGQSNFRIRQSEDGDAELEYRIYF